MQYLELGKTNLTVSRLCYGSLVIGPLQANLPVEEAAALLRYGFEAGINFVDTAEIYDNYEAVHQAIKGIEEQIVVATKCYAYTREQMQKSLDAARSALNRDYIDIFHLHEQESALTLRGHQEALEYLQEAKQKGMVKAVGVSTHYIACVEAAAEHPIIDVIHPLLNKQGIGIQDGVAAEMVAAVEEAKLAGKGIYAMKALGGGHLLQDPEDALRFVLNLDSVESIAVGMQSQAEIDFNLKVFLGEPVPEELRLGLQRTPRRLLIEDWCQQCGRCIERCSAQALYRDKDDGGRVRARQEHCTLCGYCAAVCPEFALKVI